MRFSAKKTAGEITLDLQNGESKTYDIEVLDIVKWEEYNALQEEYAKRQKDSGEEVNSDEAKAMFASKQIDLMIRQLNLFIPISKEQLRGFAINDLAAIIKYCVERATGAEVSDEEKKS